MNLPDVIETERLTLRPLRPSDAGPITLYAGDRRVAEMLTSVPHPYPPGAAEQFIASALNGRLGEQVWALDATKIDGPEFIGTIGMKRRTPPELGYWVGPPFWRTGYASEAAQAVVAAVMAAGAPSITALVFAENEASASVLLSAGFHETGAAEDFSVARGGKVAVRRFALEFAAAGA